MPPLSDFSPTLNTWFNASGEYAGPAEFRVQDGPLIRVRDLSHGMRRVGAGLRLMWRPLVYPMPHEMRCQISP